MEYEGIKELKAIYHERKRRIAKETLESYSRAFSIEYTHNSTAIEGNTLTMIETKAILEDGLSVGGKTLREIYEVVNHEKAFNYVCKCILENKELSESIVKDIHAVTMENIMTGGIYRSVDVYISGAEHTPPSPNEMYNQIKMFYCDLKIRKDLNDIELAAWTHAEFVRIHPFTDGNGRTARLIMNYQLMKNGYLPVSIDKRNRLEYYEALEEYAVNQNLSPFSDMIFSLETQRLEKLISMAQEIHEEETEEQAQELGIQNNIL